MRKVKQLMSYLVAVLIIAGLFSVHVYAAGKPVITLQPKNVTAYVGTTAKFKVSATEADSYQWQYRTSTTGSWKAATATGNKTATLSVPATESRNGYQYRCQVKNTAGTTNSTAATLTVKKTPVITTQPKSVSATAGTTAKFTVKADGAASYQWKYRTSSTGTWKNATATGNKTETLSVPATENRNGYQYRCQLKNGQGTINSNAVTLTVRTAPTITTQPISQVLEIGGTAKFEVQAAGAVSYQWQYRTSETGNWKAATAAGNKTAILSVPVTAGRNGYQYRCQVKNDVGTTNSQAVTLNAFAIITQPVDITTDFGTTAEFKVEAVGAISYQWEYRVSETGTWKAATATGNKTGLLSVPATINRDGYQYRCKIVTGAESPLYTNAVTLTVNNVLRIKTQPLSLTELMQEDDVSLHVEAIGGKAPYSYQWQYRVKEYGTPGEYAEIESDDWYFKNMNTDTLNGKFVIEFEEYGYEFRCAVTDADGKTVYSEPAAFSGKWMILKQPANDMNGQVGCLASFGVTVQGGKYPLDYQWQYSNDDTEGFVDVTGKESWHYGYYKNSSLTVDVELEIYTKHYKFRCIITDADGKTLTSDVVELTPEFKINKQPVSVTANLGDEVEFETAAFSSTNHDNAYLGFTPLSYQWQYKTSEMEEFANLTSTMLVEGIQTKKISFNVSSNVLNYKFRCVITNALGEQLITDEVSVITPLLIETQPTNFKGNIGETAEFTIKAIGGVAPYSYQWKYKMDGMESFENFTESDEWAEGFETDKLSMQISLAEFRDNYQYYCIVTDQNNKSVISQTVKVEPESVYIVKQPKDDEGEPGETAIFNVEVSGGEAPYSYQWQYTYDTLDGYENFAGGCTWADGYKGEQLEVSLSNDIFRDEYHFRCVITDYNGKQVISDEVTVMNTAFRIVEQPMDAYAAVNDIVTFTVEVAGGKEPYTYLWNYTAPGVTGSVNSAWADGRETSTLTLKGVTAYMIENYSFYCVVKDGSGTELITNEVRVYPVE